ncbi:MAG: 6-phosphogluconolactonase [Sulfitobacter sp.]
MKLNEYTTRDALMSAVAEAIAADLSQALTRRETVTLAVPGGTTPGPVFDALSGVDLDWSRVHVVLSDERWVPEDHPQSNAALIRKRLLTGQAASAAFTPYYTEGSDIETAAAQLSSSLAPMLPIDVLLLGMGADMHTASLFPGAQGVAAAMEDDAPMLLPITIEGQDVKRFTLSAPALRAAGMCHVLITGEEKRTALAQADKLEPAQAPVKTVLDNSIVHWSAA